MARSYKKNPVLTDGKSGRIGKRFANKKVRRMKGEIPDGKSYRKIYESWNIHDYVSRESYADHRAMYESSLKAFINGGSTSDPREKRGRRLYDDNRWKKFYLRK